MSSFHESIPRPIFWGHGDLKRSGPCLNDTGLAQGLLFDGVDRQKQSRVDAVADQIKERFGPGALRRVVAFAAETPGRRSVVAGGPTAKRGLCGSAPGVVAEGLLRVAAGAVTGPSLPSPGTYVSQDTGSIQSASNPRPAIRSMSTALYDISL